MSAGLAVAVAALATYLWRGLGVLLSGRVSPTGPLFEWVGCVAYALLSALIARIILLPVGALEATTLWTRLMATATALAVFYLARRRLPAGVAAGVATLMLLETLRRLPAFAA